MSEAGGKEGLWRPSVARAPYPKVEGNGRDFTYDLLFGSKDGVKKIVRIIVHDDENGIARAFQAFADSHYMVKIA